MQDDKAKRSKRKRREGPPAQKEVPLKPVGEMKITYKKSLESPAKEKRIHPRRELRRVPERKP